MQAGGSSFRESVGVYRTGVWSHGWRVTRYSAVGIEALHISMLRNKVHYIIPHMLSETRPTGERYRKVVVFGYGVFASLPSLLCSPLSCCQRETEREREGEHVGDFLYFQAFFGGFNINIGGWRYLNAGTRSYQDCPLARKDILQMASSKSARNKKKTEKKIKFQPAPVNLLGRIEITKIMLV